MITLSHDSKKGAVVLGGFFDESADEGVFAVNEAATSSAEVMQTPGDMHGIHETSDGYQVGSRWRRKAFSDRALAWLNGWFCDFTNRQVNLYGSVVETRFRAYEGPGADAPKGFLLGFE